MRIQLGYMRSFVDWYLTFVANRSVESESGPLYMCHLNAYLGKQHTHVVAGCSSEEDSHP